MIIDLLGGSYDNKYKSWNSQRTVNWYPQQADGKEKDKTQMALFPRPGLKQFAVLDGNPVRGLFTADSLTQVRCFAVTGTSLWEIFYNGSTSLIGTLTGMAVGSDSKVYMALNGVDQLMIQDPLAGYIFNLDTNVLTRITSVDYNRGTTLDYADGYFIVSGVDGMVHFNSPNDGFTWPGFNFFAATFKPDSVKAIVASREEIYCFGDTTIEVYINDGVAPFVRLPRTSLFYGLTARDSIAVHHSGTYFLGKTPTGGNDVYMMGLTYQVTPISTPAIAQKLNSVGDNADAEGFIVSTKDGHIFYHLHL